MVPSLATLALFLPAAVLVAATPGPSNFLCFTNGVRVGVAASVLALFGRMAAFAILVALVAAGVGALLEASETAFTVLKWGGVLYLLYLALKLWRAPPASMTPAATGADGALGLARKEFAVAITNPKAILIFTAFVPQFVAPAGSATAQLLVLGALYLGVEFAVASAYVAAGALVRRVNMTPARAALTNRISAGMMLAAAALLATTRKGT